MGAIPARATPTRASVSSDSSRLSAPSSSRHPTEAALTALTETIRVPRATLDRGSLSISDLAAPSSSISIRGGPIGPLRQETARATPARETRSDLPLTRDHRVGPRSQSTDAVVVDARTSFSRPQQSTTQPTRTHAKPSGFSMDDISISSSRSKSGDLFSFGGAGVGPQGSSLRFSSKGSTVEMSAELRASMGATMNAGNTVFGGRPMLGFGNSAVAVSGRAAARYAESGSGLGEQLGRAPSSQGQSADSLSRSSPLSFQSASRITRMDESLDPHLARTAPFTAASTAATMGRTFRSSEFQPQHQHHYATERESQRGQSDSLSTRESHQQPPRQQQQQQNQLHSRQQSLGGQRRDRSPQQNEQGQQGSRHSVLRPGQVAAAVPRSRVSLDEWRQQVHEVRVSMLA